MANKKGSTGKPKDKPKNRKETALEKKIKAVEAKVEDLGNGFDSITEILPIIMSQIDEVRTGVKALVEKKAAAGHSHKALDILKDRVEALAKGVNDLETITEVLGTEVRESKAPVEPEPEVPEKAETVAEAEEPKIIITPAEAATPPEAKEEEIPGAEEEAAEALPEAAPEGKEPAEEVTYGEKGASLLQRFIAWGQGK